MSEGEQEEEPGRTRAQEQEREEEAYLLASVGEEKRDLSVLPLA